MKRSVSDVNLAAVSLCLVALCLSGCSAETKDETATPVTLDTFEQKVSYALGQEYAANLERMGAKVEPDFVAWGLTDALKGEEAALPEDEARRVLTEFRQQLMARTNRDRSEQGARNREVGQKFLADNRNQPGVQTTASGLQYKILEEGTGSSPAASDRVKVHYRGTLINGTEFDSSYQRNTPATFGVSNLIKGWTEALQMMKVGSKWELYIPPDLAYGERGSGPQIGPYATLIFQVELLEIVE
jgi:FKBP-type peptidyl-prolyl cis-trans isomerase